MLILTESDLVQQAIISQINDREDYLVELADKMRGLRKLVGHQRPVRHKNYARTDDAKFRLERARYARLEDEFRVRCSEMIRSFLGGHVSQKQLIKNFSNNLAIYQTTMYLQGKRTTGIISVALTQQERAWLHGQHSSEMKYFHRFMRDVSTGSGKMDYRKRMDLYGVGGYSLYLRGVIAAIPNAEDIRWTWNLNARAEHCQECVRRHWVSRKEGGFTTEKLLKMGLPGEKTPCGNRCRCGCSPIDSKYSLSRTRPTSYNHLRSLIGVANG